MYWYKTIQLNINAALWGIITGKIGKLCTDYRDGKIKESLRALVISYRKKLIRVKNLTPALSCRRRRRIRYNSCNSC